MVAVAATSTSDRPDHPDRDQDRGHRDRNDPTPATAGQLGHRTASRLAGAGGEIGAVDQPGAPLADHRVGAGPRLTAVGVVDGSKRVDVDRGGIAGRVADREGTHGALYPLA